MRVVKCLAATIGVAGLMGIVQAADLVHLGWGDFTIESDSPSKPKSLDVKAGASGMSVAMTFDTMTAKADGDIKDASASISGHFAVQQPQSVSLSNLHVELKGHIVKTAGSTARIDVTIGDTQRAVEWAEGDVLADAFSRTIDIAVTSGQLPNPFMISAVVAAKKISEKGAAIITLEAIDVDAGPAKVASHTP